MPRETHVFFHSGSEQPGQPSLYLCERYHRAQAGRGGIRTILWTTIDGYYLVDQEGRFLDTNDSYCRMIGYSREELLKMALKDIEAIETDKVIQARIQQIMKTGSAHFETKHKRKDGRIIDIEASVNRLEGAQVKLVVFMRDITERKRAEEALRISEEQFRRIFQHLGSGMALVSPDLHFLQVNDGFCRMLGYTESELVGKNFQDVTHPEDRPVGGKLVRLVLSGEMGTFQLEKRYLRKDGTVVWGLKQPPH